MNIIEWENHKWVKQVEKINSSGSLALQHYYQSSLERGILGTSAAMSTENGKILSEAKLYVVTW